MDQQKQFFSNTFLVGYIFILSVIFLCPDKVQTYTIFAFKDLLVVFLPCVPV